MRAVGVVLLVVAFGLLPACTTMSPQSEAMSEAPPESREWRLANLEKSFLEFQERERQMRTDVQEKLSVQDNRIMQLEEMLGQSRQDLSSMQAEVEVMSSTANARQNAAPMSEAPMRKQPMAEQPMAKPAPQRTAMASEPAPEPKRFTPFPEESAPAPKAMRPKRTAIPSPESDPAYGTYMRGLELVRAGDTEQGRKILNDFIAANPKSPLMPNALYWLGETYYHDKRYAQCILTFREVTKRFPEHDKAAAAMLKIGFAYDRLGDAANAEFYLRTLVEEYPQSGPARLARDKLASM